MTHIHINLIAYSIWVAVAAVFGFRRYTNIGCEVAERYLDFEERSHNWARVVAIIMMVVVEILYWRPLNQLWTIWKMEEEASFFTFIFLAGFAYGLHCIFRYLVKCFEKVSYDRAEDVAQDYCEGCERCCRQADYGATELPECPFKGYAKACPCLEDGYDIQDVNYASEVMDAIGKFKSDDSHHGIVTSSPISIRVPVHRVVIKENPYNAFFCNQWAFDIELDGIDLLVNEVAPKTAKIINFPAATAVRAPEPEEIAAKKLVTVPRRKCGEACRLCGQHGSFALHLVEDGVTCNLARDLPNGEQFRREVLVPNTKHYQSLEEFMHSKEGQLLLMFINLPTLTEQQLAKLG